MDADSKGRSSKFLGKEDTEENRAAFVSMIPLGRRCDPTDIANACAYLGSEEATFVTGINMEVWRNHRTPSKQIC
jgi:hypothetical protein